MGGAGGGSNDSAWGSSGVGWAWGVGVVAAKVDLVGVGGFIVRDCGCFPGGAGCGGGSGSAITSSPNECSSG